ncbi:hypothetical protein [Thalassiella azotivora]
MIDVATAVEHDFKLKFLPRLEREFHCRLLSLEHEHSTAVLHLALELPHDADRQLRHQILDELFAFEQQQNNEVAVSPALVTRGDDDD